MPKQQTHNRNAAVVQCASFHKLEGHHMSFIASICYPSGVCFNNIWQKYTIPEITFMVSISSWNFVCVPKAMLWAHVHSISLKFSSDLQFMQYTNFQRISWRVCKMLVKQPTGVTLSFVGKRGQSLFKKMDSAVGLHMQMCPEIELDVTNMHSLFQLDFLSDPETQTHDRNVIVVQ